MGFFYKLKQEFRFSCQEPLTYPYGCIYTSIAQFLLLVAWSLSLVTIYNCYFINARPIPEEDEPTLNFLGYGLMNREGGGADNNVFSKCGRYSDFQADQHIDAAWGFATAFNWMAMLIGGMIVLILMTTCCLTFHNNYIFKRLAGVVAVCFILQILVFCAYGNSLLCGGEDPLEYICEWGSGSGLNLGACVFWLLAAFMIFLWPVEDDPEEPADPEVPAKPERKLKLPMLTMGEPKAKPKEDLPQLTNGPSPRKSKLPQLTNGQSPRKSNNLQLTNGEDKPKRPSTLKITNGEQTFKVPQGNRKSNGRRSNRNMS
ncbi:unnamed protein product [Cylindrotheca closterium]|uniref:Uncharacterized protein n=1 Tax=Cylindrotheca closterium TaxID=2856 RepID=A0AAD2G8W1_9STRA|nr:unnamed protein product [Cylindrotheca closterium]